jgi:hypothetical protein
MDTTAIVAALVVVGIVSAWLWWDRRSVSRAAEAQLRRICFGDEGQVERLIEAEMRRAPGAISRADAARRAVERYQRDNR